MGQLKPPFHFILGLCIPLGRFPFTICPRDGTEKKRKSLQNEENSLRQLSQTQLEGLLLV